MLDVFQTVTTRLQFPRKGYISVVVPYTVCNILNKVASQEYTHVSLCVCVYVRESARARARARASAHARARVCVVCLYSRRSI